jgi:hypothetical protein
VLATSEAPNAIFRMKSNINLPGIRRIGGRIEPQPLSELDAVILESQLQKEFLDLEE